MSIIKKRYSEIDIFKGLCILAVVAIHMSGIILNNGTLPISKMDDYYLFSVITRFCVPGFILASGFLLALKKLYINPIPFLLNRLIYIITPYLIWSVFYSYFWSKLNGVPLNLKNNLLFGTASYHLYFIIVIVQFYVIFLIVQKLIEYIKPWHLGVLLICQLLFNDWARNNGFHISGYNLVTTFFPWVFIFFFGCYVGRNYSHIQTLLIKLRPYLWGGLFISMFYQLCRYLQMFFEGVKPKSIPDGIVIFLTLFVFTLVVSYNKEIGKFKNSYLIRFLNRIGLLSFGIYLVHPIIIPFFVLKVVPKFTVVSFPVVIIIYAITFLLSWLLIEFLRKIKLSRFLIGK